MARKGRENADAALATGLASGLCIRDAAREAHVSERTAHRRLADPHFTARVESIRSGLVSEALVKLQGAMSGAADVLRGLLAHTDPHVRIRAAVEVLRNAVRVREQAELVERIRRLELLLTERIS